MSTNRLPKWQTTGPTKEFQTKISQAFPVNVRNMIQNNDNCTKDVLNAAQNLSNELRNVLNTFETEIQKLKNKFEKK